MDSITHTILGVCLGEVIAGRQLGKKTWVLGAIAANIPDLDVISKFWLTEAEALLAHRGFTHSILFVVLGTVALALICKKIFPLWEMTYPRWLTLIGSGMVTHILLDALTAYGTGWYEPFDHSRVSFNALFIIDPLLALPLLAGAIAILVLRKDQEKRMRWAKRSLWIGTVYLLLVVLNAFYVNSVIKKNIREQNLSADDFVATPTPFNSLLWYVIVKDSARYHVAYYSILDSGPMSFWEIDRGDTLLTESCDSDDLRTFLDFTDGYYCVTKSADTIIVSDMRFGQQGGWDGTPAPFVFNFYIEGSKGYCSNLQHGRFKFMNSGSVKDLIRRIGGKKNTPAAQS